MRLISFPVSSPPNSPFDLEPPPVHEPSRFPAPTDSENPPWSGWEVLQIAALAVVSISVFLFVVAVAAHRWLFPKLTLVDVARIPLLTVVAQLLGYLMVLGFMVSLVKRRPGISFWREIRWNWPKNWSTFLGAGVVLSFALQGIAHFLPMPKELPIDRFFQTSTEAWVLSFFGVTVAPFMEELFFRGFLYPVLARRLGVVIGVLLTAAAFGLIHAPQLGRAWGPVLVVFLVGLALTITRAVTKSVAAGMLIHIAYNGTLSLLIFGASDGFRHLEKLNQ
jgi:membrane protease YdiL (CAAX protease family)